MSDLRQDNGILDSPEINRYGLIAVATPPALAAIYLAIDGHEASASNENNNVCGPLDSGKIDTQGDPSSVTVTAPAGFLVDQYCVKAGSVNNNNGPVYRNAPEDFDAQQSISFSYPNGKDISHYSFGWSPLPTTTTEPHPTTTSTPDTTTTSTPDTTTTSTPDTTTTSTPDTTTTSTPDTTTTSTPDTTTTSTPDTTTTSTPDTTTTSTPDTTTTSTPDTTTTSTPDTTTTSTPDTTTTSTPDTTTTSTPDTTTTEVPPVVTLIPPVSSPPETTTTTLKPPTPDLPRTGGGETNIIEPALGFVILGAGLTWLARRKRGGPVTA